MPDQDNLNVFVNCPFDKQYERSCRLLQTARRAHVEDTTSPY